ncbi:MAG: efflux RND transporter periplasmic adaptor subunit [Chitinophagaceae bacterium]|nr:efflux RND transporter periplasmic adaptor subunit [Chitinophagaceae bacterium]
MSKGKIIFWSIILLSICALAYVKYNKSIEAASKSAQPPGKGKNQNLVAEGYIAEPSSLAIDVSANGTILAQDQVTLQPEAAGRVTFLNIKEGAIVPKGTLILKTNDAELQAQLAKLKKQLTIAQSNKSRLEQLLAINGASKAEYDAADNAVNNIVADINLLEVQIAKTELRTPFTGKLGLRNISLGAYVSPTTSVVTLQNNSALKMDISIPEKYSNVLNIGDILTCSVAGDHIVNFRARVIAKEPTINETTRNLTVRAAIENPTQNLVPGAYVNVNFRLKNTPNTIMIPSNCIIPDDRASKVVVSDSGMVKFVPVEIGERNETEIQIISGLKFGDTILTTGLLQAKPGMPVKIIKINRRTISGK